jgi:hypothetical protein
MEDVQCRLELELVEGPDGEVGVEEAEEKLEARREGEPTQEGERLSRLGLHRTEGSSLARSLSITSTSSIDITYF